MAVRDTDTKARILAAARRLLRAGGPSKVTFDAVAAEVGVTKQAVIYWFPTKARLGAALVLPALEAEGAAVRDAVAGRTGARAAEAAVRALAAYHLADLERFRLMYVAPQMGGGRGDVVDPDIHATTARMYGALASALGEGAGEAETRRRAVALHAAVVGLVTMVALADALDDPLKHGAGDLVEALVAQMAGA